VSSLPGYEVGSALSVLPNITQNRSCHEKGRSARIYVIIRDGTNTVIYYKNNSLHQKNETKSNPS
jgi:hypothetical protein